MLSFGNLQPRVLFVHGFYSKCSGSDFCDFSLNYNFVEIAFESCYFVTLVKWLQNPTKSHHGTSLPMQHCCIHLFTVPEFNSFHQEFIDWWFRHIMSLMSSEVGLSDLSGFNEWLLTPVEYDLEKIYKPPATVTLKDHIYF